MAVHAPWRLGTITAGSLVADPTNAPSAYDESRAYEVSVPGLPDITAEIARKEPTGTERGTLVLFSGADGSGWWGGTPGSEAWIDTRKVEGWRVFQVRWTGSGGWGEDSGDSNRGPAYCAGRVAGVIKDLYDTHVAPNVVNLALSGNSGGATQAVYCLTHHQLGSLIDAAVPTGGPPYGHILAGCRLDAGFAYESNNANQIDDAYAVDAAAGDCANANVADMGSTWHRDSHLGGRIDWPCRVVYVLGDGDTTASPAHAEHLASLQPGSVVAYAEGTPHNVGSTDVGRALIADAINDRPIIRQSVVGLEQASATSITATFDEQVLAGDPIILVHRASTDPANVVTPDGYSVAIAIAHGTNAGTKIFWKVADGTETGATVSTGAVSTLHELSAFEGWQFGVTSWVVDQADATPVASNVGTIDCGPTDPTTAAKELCFAAVCWRGNPGTSNNDWTGGFLHRSATSRQAVATRSTEATGAQSSTLTWSGATNTTACLVTFKAAP